MLTYFLSFSPYFIFIAHRIGGFLLPGPAGFTFARLRSLVGKLLLPLL